MKNITFLIFKRIAISFSVTSWYWFSTIRQDNSKVKYLFALYWTEKSMGEQKMKFTSLCFGPLKVSIGFGI